eukprot:8636176-Alexandrium_andersonii.AAC.1
MCIRDRPFGGPGTVFPPRPPAAPNASILNTGALAADHLQAMEEHIAEAEATELPPLPMAEA